MGPDRNPIARRRRGDRPNVVAVVMGHENRLEPVSRSKLPVDHFEQLAPLRPVFRGRVHQVAARGSHEDGVRVSRGRQRARPAGDHRDAGRITDRRPQASRLPVASPEDPVVGRPPLQEANNGRRQRHLSAEPTRERRLGTEHGLIDDLPGPHRRFGAVRQREPVEAGVEPEGGRFRRHEFFDRGEVRGIDFRTEALEDLIESNLAGEEALAEFVPIGRRQRPPAGPEKNSCFLKNLAHRGRDAGSRFGVGRAADRDLPIPFGKRPAGERPQVRERPEARRAPNQQHFIAAGEHHGHGRARRSSHLPGSLVGRRAEPRGPNSADPGAPRSANILA